MKHGITELEWNEYLDGNANASLRDRIEAHLIGCWSCWEFYEGLASASQTLDEASAEARAQLTLDDRRLHLMVHNIFARVHSEPAPIPNQTQIQTWLEALKTVLTPICGKQMASRVLQAAAKLSPAQSLERVRPENWEPFLDRLTSIAEAMCGDTFATLVQEKGQR
ncbi:MAG TPA: hypothetical protein PLK30_16685 [Blastocatellia bacterium]|nr:hypothetical protein [Blastocatellia bacterium]